MDNLQGWKAYKEDFKGAKYPDEIMEDITNSCGREYVKMRMKGLVTSNISHDIDKSSHTCYETSYTEPLEKRYPKTQVEWSHVFCPKCKKVIRKRGVLINKSENTVYVRNFID